MASDLGITVSVSAIVGGALTGLSNISKAMGTLKSSTEALKKKQSELGEQLMRNKDRLSANSLRQLTNEHIRLDASVEKLTASYRRLQNVAARREAVKTQWEGLKGKVYGAAAAVGTLAIPVKLAIDFESAMADVKKVVDFDTPEQFRQMERDILGMTRNIPMAAGELAKITAAGGQLGVPRKDLQKFTETIAKMSVAFDMSAEQAGDSMAKLANVYEIPIAQIGRLGDAINHLSNSSPAKAGDIVNTLSRVGGVAKQFGLTEMQTASLSNAFISLGRTPEVAGTAINGMLTKLMTADKQGAKFQKVLHGMGTDAKALKKAIKDNGEQALLDFLNQINKLPKESQMGALVDLFGLEYADDVAALVGGLDSYKKSVEALKKSGKNGLPEFSGSMEKEFAERSATTANQLRRLKSALIELGITVGNMILPTVADFAAWITRLIHNLTDWTNKHPALVKSIVGIAAALLSFVAGHFVVLVAVNRLVALLLTLKGGFLSLKTPLTLISSLMKGGLGLSDIPGTLGTVMRGFAAARTVIAGFGLSSLAALWPVVLAVAAVAAVAFVIYKYWKPLKAFFAGFWEGLTKGLEPLTPLFDAFVGTLSGIWTAVQPYLQPVLDWFGDFFNLTQAGEGNARSWGESVGSALASVVNTVVSVGTMIVDGWRMIFDGISSLVGSAWTEIKTAFDGGLLGILGLILNWSPIGAFYSAFAAVLSWFGIDLPARFTEFGSNIIQGLWNGLQAKFEAVRAWLAEKAAALKNTFAGVMDIHSPSRVFRRFGGWMMQGLQLGIDGGASRPLSAVMEAAGRLKNGFAEQAGGLAARISGSADVFAAEHARQGQTAMSGGITVHFSPTINAPGGDAGQIQTAMQMGYREFEQMFRRMMEDWDRRSYVRNAG